MNRRATSLRTACAFCLALAVVLLAVAAPVIMPATAASRRATSRGRVRVYFRPKGGTLSKACNIKKHVIHDRLKAYARVRGEAPNVFSNDDKIKVKVVRLTDGGYDGTSTEDSPAAVPVIEVKAGGTMLDSPAGCGCPNLAAFVWPMPLPRNPNTPPPPYACAYARTITKDLVETGVGSKKRVRHFKWVTEPLLLAQGGGGKWAKAWYKSKDPVRFVAENPGLPDTLSNVVELGGLEMVGFSYRHVEAGTDIPGYEFLYNLGINYVNDTTSVDADFESNPILGLVDADIEAAVEAAFVVTQTDSADSASGTYTATLDSLHLFEVLVTVPAHIDSFNVSAADTAFCVSPADTVSAVEPTSWGKLKARYR